VGEVKEESVHFLMVPEPREELIDTNIEAAVSRMQSVIELGRVSRDRRTLPIKYPLKEVVVVNEDEGFLKEVESLRTYIIEVCIAHATICCALYCFGYLWSVFCTIYSGRM